METDKIRKIRRRFKKNRDYEKSSLYTCCRRFRKIKKARFPAYGMAIVILVPWFSVD